MAKNHDVNHPLRRAAIITVALGACLIFGIVVLVAGDWLPGGITVAASSVGLAREVPTIRSLRRLGHTASPSHHKAAK